MALVLGIDELWAPVPDFPGYEVSNLGGIRSKRRGNTWRPLKGEIDKDGYKRVTLNRNGKQSKFPLHRLIAICFVAGRTPERDIAAHRNGDNTNNAASNLKWATQAENIADKIEHGTHQIGKKHPRAQINETLAAAIKASLRAGESARFTAQAYEVSLHIVHDISRGRTWRHVC